MALSEGFNEQTVECPFVAEPCPRGDDAALECQHRVAQDFDPVERFNDFQIVYCAVCQQHVRVGNGSASAYFSKIEEKPDPLDFIGCGA
jgi:hypothetical protein